MKNNVELSEVMFTVEGIAACLRFSGVNLWSTTEADTEVDGEIVLSDVLHVQVGESYLMLWKKITEDEYHVLYEGTSFRALARAVNNI